MTDNKKYTEDQNQAVASDASYVLPAAAPPSLSNLRLFLIASAPCVVWWAGTMNICGMGFLLPVIQKELNTTDGQVQWVRRLATEGSY